MSYSIFYFYLLLFFLLFVPSELTNIKNYVQKKMLHVLSQNFMLMKF